MVRKPCRACDDAASTLSGVDKAVQGARALWPMLVKDNPLTTISIGRLQQDPKISFNCNSCTSCSYRQDEVQNLLSVLPLSTPTTDQCSTHVTLTLSSPKSP